MIQRLSTIGNGLAVTIERGLDRMWPGQSLAGVEPADVAWWQRPARWLFVLLLLAAFPVAVNRSIRQSGGTDFPAFYWSAHHLLVNGERHHHSEFLRYLPSADVPWVVLATLPLPVAAVVYYLLGCWSYMGLLSTTGRFLLAECSAARRRQTMLLVGLLVMPVALDGLAVGSFHIFMVWLMVAGLSRVARGQEWRGGLLLGLAIWVKLLPALGAAYLLLKRKWLPALIALGAVVVFDIVLSIVGYGFQRGWDEHVTWWRDEGSGALHRQLQSPEVIDEDRTTNQSIAVILRRVLTTFGIEAHNPRRFVSVADLSANQLRLVYLAIIGALGLVGLYYCRRPWHQTSSGQWSTEIALMALGTLWFSPVVWSYHPTAVVPALAILLGKSDQNRRMAWTAAVVWLGAMLLFAIPPVRVLGQMTLASVFLGGALVWVTRGTPPPRSVMTGNPSATKRAA